MKKSEIKTIKVTDISRSGNNARKINKAELEKSDLYKSIKNNGIKQAPTVRRKGKGFELLAGDRRLTCAELQGIKTIECIVTDCTDIAAYDITHFENADRQNLSPLEMSRDSGLLMKQHRDPAVVAKILGLSVQQVKMRNNIQKLSPKWKKYLETYDDISVAHLDLIARMPAEAQDLILMKTSGGKGYDIARSPVIKFRKWLDEIFLHNIAVAEWAQEKCASCKKRSTAGKGQADLWEEENDNDTEQLGYCLDVKCWDRNKALAETRKIKAIIKENPGCKFVTDGYIDWQVNQNLEKKYGSITSVGDYNEYHFCKAAAKGAVKAVCVGGPRPGKLVYIMSRNYSASTLAAGKSGKPKPKTIAERKKLHRSKIWHAAISEIQDLVAAAAMKDLTVSVKTLPALIVIFGTDCKRTGRDKSEWMKADKKWSSAEINKEIFKQLLPVLSSRIHHSYGVTQITDGLIFEVRKVSLLLGISSGEIFIKHKADKPDPKIWLTLNADGTKKEPNAPAKKKPPGS